MSKGQKFTLLCIVIAGMLLRFWGLSHDLHENNIYHPDTPKQVRATERFLNGNYYYHIGILDYDAYPYFNPHLVEYICRAAGVAKATACNIVNVPFTINTPDMITLFWITRILNALLATALILLVFQIGKENFGVKSGLLAALLTALSPVDMIACHFAGAETTACFFTVLALLFAFRIYRNGLYRDYLLAGICTAFAFATKYHAAIVIVPILLAHGLRTKSLRSVLGGASIRRLLLLTLAGIAACFLAIPTLADNFAESVRDIANFFAQISSGRGMSTDTRSSHALVKFLYSMKRNIPILVTIVGPLVFFAVLAELFDTIRRRNPLKLILFALPCVYFLIGVSMRPMANPVYHTLMTPIIFLVAALFFTAWTPSRRIRRQWLRHLLGIMAIISAGYLLYVSAQQAFFFWHQDTSRAAQAWVSENVPPTFQIIPGGYTFCPDARQNSTAAPNGTILAESNLRSLDKPASASLWKTFSLEPLSLAIFINPTIALYKDRTEGLENSFLLPSFPRWPSQTGNHFAFDNGPEFVRSEKQMHLPPRDTIVRWFVRSNELERVWIHFRNGFMPNVIEFSFGRISKHVSLNSGEAAWFAIRQPAANFPSQGNHLFYRFIAKAAHGPATALVATRLDEIATSLYDAGLHHEAAALLAKAATQVHNPSIAASAIICDTISSTNILLAGNHAIMSDAKRVFGVTNSDSMQRVYGISLKYLDSLKYISIGAEDLTHNDFGASGAGHSPSNSFMTTRNMLLAPGYYTASIDVRSAANTPVAATARLCVVNRSGGICHQQEIPFDLAPDSWSYTLSASFMLTADNPEVMLRLEIPSQTRLLADGLTIKPDILRNIAAQGRILKTIETFDPAAGQDEPLAYDALIALGDFSAKRTGFADAYAFYAAAAKARPDLKTHIIRINSIRSNLPEQQRAPFSAAIESLLTKSTLIRNTSDALFDDGIRFVGFSISNPAITSGQSLGLNLFWRPEKASTHLDEYNVFVHILDDKGKIVFQADHPLVKDLVMPRDNMSIHPRHNQYPVPQGVKTGAYQIQIGVYKPASGRRIKILSSSFETQPNAIILPINLMISSGADA